MAIIKPEILKGLKGLQGLSLEEQDIFLKENKDKILRHAFNPEYANNLYFNQQFVDRYGMDTFKAMPNIKQRRALYEKDLIGEAWKEYTNGLDDEWVNQYDHMSDEGKLKLMESDWLNPREFDDKWKKKCI